MINNIQGIEGDDLPYQLQLLGFDVKNINPCVYFFALNDHYNTHRFDWLDNANSLAKQADTVVFYDLVNTGDFEHTRFCEFISNYDHPNKVYLTVNQSPKLQLAGVRIVQWDFMWNRIKSYYTENIPAYLMLHHYAGPQAYKLNNINFDTTRLKKFLSMCGREYGYRTHLYNFVKDYDGYVSNRSKNIYLEEREIVGAFNPVTSAFYDNSYISIYVESNCIQPNLIHTTEKTFEPLLKGHFILPFSNPGTIHRIKELGFKLPDFVDYSYDDELDTETRFKMLTAEFQRLLTLDLATLYTQNKEIIIHNRQCLHTIPYDNRILEIFNV
jgi:hypothetical protein